MRERVFGGKFQFIQGLVSSSLIEHLQEKNKLFPPWRVYYDVAWVSRAVECFIDFTARFSPFI